MGVRRRRMVAVGGSAYGPRRPVGCGRSAATLGSPAFRVLHGSPASGLWVNGEDVEVWIRRMRAMRPWMDLVDWVVDQIPPERVRRVLDESLRRLGGSPERGGSGRADGACR